MDAASIEELNKVRRAMGMKPLPVPGEAPKARSPTPEGEDKGSTLETREAASYDNYKKALEAEAAKKKREERAAAIKKAREMAQRNAILEGKGIADDVEDDELDAKAWLKNQKKRQKQIQAAKKAEEDKAAAEAAAAAAEHTARDLAGVKVAHDMNTFLEGGDQVLTLKDTGVLDAEEEGDELENIELREREKLNERLDLKKKKPLYDPNDIDETGERTILSQYDEEINGKKKKAFTLGQTIRSTATADSLADILDSAPVQRKGQTVDLDMLDDAPAPVSDYMDASEIKVKKPKKKKTKSTRRRDDDDVLYPGETETPETEQQMEIDSGPSYTKKRKTFDEDFVDDDDLQQSLARQRSAALKKRKTRPEELAKQLREESNQPEPEAAEAGGIVIDEISEFVDALYAEREEEKKAPKPKSQPRAETAVTAMEEESSDEEMEDADKDGQQSERATSPTGELPTTGVEEEKLVAQGMAATFALLKDRRLIDAESRGSELVKNFRESAHFKAELARLMKKFDDETRLQRERDRASGRLDRMSTREREEWQRQQNTIREQHQARVMEQLFREAYKPTVELKYVDADGRSLDQKEAFKELSHQFHGKGSGKGKTDKRLKKLEAERRRMAQSMLDASQNVGMSTAASHQGKKRKEAGVRLA
ncbi:SART-1 protein [Sordaria brevicollis]|uniref:SART-1 protein n=1 Tax=Sordaria brevicollis TaxID=83679 RepID=A0AAE0PBU7_SORBR|nr:SART-1 protein [Sordaria brevicollis]